MTTILKYFVFSAILQISIFGQTELVPNKIELRNGKQFSLNLPKNYEVIPAAEGFNRIRFFAKAPDGRIFVTDMQNMSDNKNGVVYALGDWDEKTGKFGKTIRYLINLRNPNSIAFYKDKGGQHWLYVAETHKLTRYRYSENSNKPSGEAQFIAGFPDRGRSYKYGSWHLTRTIAFSPRGKLYVSVGSSCNSCVEKEKTRATVLEMNPNGSKSRRYVTGLRNAVGLKWIGDSLFATNQGVDHLGVEAPDDTFYKLKDGANYGWSFCYQTKGRITFDPKYKIPDLPPPNCNKVPKSYAYFPAHSSALGFDYFGEDTSDELIKNSFLIALHGSTDRDDGRGYKIAIVKTGGTHKDFLTGFVHNKTVFGRPCDILKLDENSFLFTDDYSGVIYYVRKKSDA